MAHPNSLANLRPWKPGERPPAPGRSKIEQALSIAQKCSPKAAKLIARSISDPEVPISLRLRCAEYMLDKVLPSQKLAGVTLEGGIDWLELRFVAPGAQTPPETLRIAFEPEESPAEVVGQNDGQIIDADEDAADINDL